MKRHLSIGLLGIALLLGGCATEPPAQAEEQKKTQEPIAEPSTDTEPSPSSTEALENQVPVEELTWDNFPYTMNGEAYIGEEAFIESQKLTLEQYPTIESLETAFPGHLETWVNSGLTEQSAEAYEDFNSLDGRQTGLDGIRSQFYDTSFAEATLGEGENSARTWRDEIFDLHEQQTQKWLQTKDSANPALATIKLPGSSEGVLTKVLSGETPSDPNYSVESSFIFEYDDGLPETEPVKFSEILTFEVQNGEWGVVSMRESQIAGSIYDQ